MALVRWPTDGRSRSNASAIISAPLIVGARIAIVARRIDWLLGVGARTIRTRPCAIVALGVGGRAANSWLPSTCASTITLVCVCASVVVVTRGTARDRQTRTRAGRWVTDRKHMAFIAGRTHNAEALLNLTISGAPIPRNIVRVVAFLANLLRAVATHRNLGAELPSYLFGRLAVGSRAIADLPRLVPAPAPEASILACAAGVIIPRCYRRPRLSSNPYRCKLHGNRPVAELA